MEMSVKCLMENYCFFSTLTSATLTSATFVSLTLCTTTAGTTVGTTVSPKMILPFWFVWWVCVICPSGLKTVFVAWTTPLFDVITDDDPTTPVGISSSPKRLSNVVDPPCPPNGAPPPKAGAPNPGCPKGSKITSWTF